MLLRTLGTGLAGGLLGGVVGVGLVATFGFGPLDYLLRPGEDVHGRIAELENTIGALSGPSVDIASLEERLARAESARDELSARLDQFQSSGSEIVIPELAPHLTPIWSQIERHETRIAKLESAETAEPVDIGPIIDRLQGLESRFGQSGEALGARVGMLETRLRLGSGDDGRLAAAALLIGRLRDALDTGEPFIEPLERLESLVGADAVLARLVERLRPHANGVATFETLLQELDMLQPGTQGTGSDGEDWMARMVGNLESLVEVRRPGSEGDDPWSNARAAMARKNLADAHDAVAELDLAGDHAAEAWRRRAGTRLIVMEAVAHLDESVRNPPCRTFPIMIRLAMVLAIWSVLGILAAMLADSGMVTVDWRDYEIRIHGGLLAAGLLLLIVAAVLLFELWRWMIGMPKRHRERKSHKNQVLGYQALAHGMVAAAAGDSVAAGMHAKQASRLLEEEPATLLLSAQTAQLEGQDDVAQLRFKAMLEEPETEFLGLRGLLAHAVRRGAYEEALELARKAHALRPSTPWVLTTLFDLLTRAELWTDAMDIVTQIGRLKLFHKDEVDRRRRAASPHDGRGRAGERAPGGRPRLCPPGRPPAPGLCAFHRAGSKCGRYAQAQGPGTPDSRAGLAARTPPGNRRRLCTSRGERAPS